MSIESIQSSGGPWGYGTGIGSTSGNPSGAGSSGFWMGAGRGMGTSYNRTDRSGGRYVPEITLGGLPVVSVNQVKVDGAIVDPSLYRLDDNKFLVHLRANNDPGGANVGWPTSQALDLADDQVGTFSVNYTYGRGPGPGGVAACATLACQLAISASPSSDNITCALPSRVTQIVRQNTTISMLPLTDIMKLGPFLGVYEIDVWLKAVNPRGLTRRATVSSPDMPARIRHTNT